MKENINDNIVEKVKEAFKDTPVGTELTRSQIKAIVTKYDNIKLASICPSDYCYNRVNKGAFGDRKLNLFEYVARNTYRYLGEIDNYTGKIYRKPAGSSIEMCVGEWKDGKLYLDSVL